jgi:DNA-binding CsgD family transcriptional regulator
MQLLVVIDEKCRVKFCSSGNQNHELERLLTEDGSRLRPEIESMAAKLIEDSKHASEAAQVALLDADRVLRLSRLVGSEETLYALIFGANHNRDSLVRAAVRYTLTRRQCEVLALILEGDSVGEIADALCITENTVQGYVKSLLSKTKSRNRPAMVAKVLDWNALRPVDSDRRVADERKGFSGGRSA